MAYANTDDFKTLYDRGWAHYEKREYDKAIADFNAALKIKPNDHNALNRRAIVYHAKRDYSRAIDDYTAALKASPSSHVILNNRGRAYIQKLDYDNAIADFTAALKIKPNEFEYLFNRGKAHNHYNNKKAKYGQAIEDFTAALKIKSSNEDVRKELISAYSNRASAYKGRWRYDLAIEDYVAALEIAPYNRNILNGRAHAYVQNGNLDLAIEDYSTIIVLDESGDFLDYHVRINRGNAYRKKGYFDKAIEDYNEAFNIGVPIFFGYKVRFPRGDAYYEKGDYIRAIADYSTALINLSDYFEEFITRDDYLNYNREYLAKRAKAYTKNQDYDLAIEDYNAILKIEPNDAEILNLRGNAYFSKNERDKAIADYTAALKISPSNNIFLFNRGYAHYMKRDYDKAIADYTAALKIYTADKEVLYYRALAYSQKGDFDDAIKDYTTALNFEPDYRLALDNRGDVYARKKDYDKAIADYTASLKIKPDEPNILTARGDVYSEKGDYDRAIADYTAALKIKPDYYSAIASRAFAYNAKDDHDLAIADFNAVLAEWSEAKPYLIVEKRNAYYTQSSFFSNRGHAYYKKGDIARAFADYTTSFKFDTAAAGALNGLGNVHYIRGNLGLALASWKEAFRIDSKRFPQAFPLLEKEPLKPLSGLRHKIAIYISSGRLTDPQKKMLETRALTRFVQSGYFMVIERNDVFLQEIAKEMKTQRSGSVNADQISRLGKQAGAEFVYVLDITEAFGYTVINARLIDTETAEVAGAGEVNIDLKNIGVGNWKVADELFSQVAWNFTEKYYKHSKEIANQGAKLKTAIYVASTALKDTEKKMLGTKMLNNFVWSTQFTVVERNDAFLREVATEMRTQRSGSVDGEQIKRLGIQSGVKYVCIIEYIKDFDNLSVRLIDMETAEIAGIGEITINILKTSDLERDEFAAKLFSQVVESQKFKQ
jgi:tetratricopeptide (TPR) repeat protein